MLIHFWHLLCLMLNIFTQKKINFIRLGLGLGLVEKETPIVSFSRLYHFYFANNLSGLFRY